jgi:NAD(P) transhydrogenase
VGAPLETFPNEQRVALTPQNAALLLKKGVSKVLIERNAGAAAQFLDTHYKAAGATIVSKEELYASSDVLFKVRPPTLGSEIDGLRKGTTLVSFLYPVQNKPIVDALAARNAELNVFAMDKIPRISRAQVFDALRYRVISSLRPVLVLMLCSLVLWRTSRAIRLCWRLRITLDGT